MEQYQVTGMSCAACSSRVEKAVSGVPGVTSCAVSLLTNSMGVEGTASSADIIRAVEAAGYGASLKGEKKQTASSNSPSWADAEALKDHETPKLKRRLSLGREKDALLGLAASLERNSEHPLAKAVAAEAQGWPLSEVSDFEALPGHGLRARLKGKELLGGSLRYLSSMGLVNETISTQAHALAKEGKTPLLFAYDGAFAGIIAVADPIKEDSAQAIGELRNMGIQTVMLTGDNERTARAISRQAGVDQVAAGVLPEGKADVIRSLKSLGKVAMVGDGMNDAPALTVADNGIAIGAGTDVAIDAADIVVMKSRLSDVTAAIRMSRATIRNIHQNLFWAFFYNAICIPLAMGLYGIEMKPMYGAAAMALSSFFVCMNALRLNLVDPHDPRHDKKRKAIPDEAFGQIAGAEETVETIQTKKEENTMTKTLKVEGMMCEHCEARVKKVLEAIPGVESAVADHAAGTAVVTLSAPVEDEALRAAVEEQDYKVLGVE